MEVVAAFIEVLAMVLEVAVRAEVANVVDASENVLDTETVVV